MLGRSNNSTRKLLVVFFCSMLLTVAETAFGQRVDLRVGMSKFLGIDPPLRDSYINQARWGSDHQYLVITDQSEAGAIVEITHYFEGTATITVFIQYVWYDAKGWPRVGSMEKFFSIKCIGSTAYLNETLLRMNVGDTFPLEVQMSSYGNFTPKWSSSKPSVASVSSRGVVAARNIGTATITCDPIIGPPVSCKIEVLEREPDRPGGGEDGGGSGDGGGSEGGNGGGGEGGSDADDGSFEKALENAVGRLEELRRQSREYIDNNRL